jgi:hypothetical protein
MVFLLVYEVSTLLKPTLCILGQVYMILVFLAAVSIFGTLISQLNDIVAAQTLENKELDETLRAYLDIRPK